MALWRVLDIYKRVASRRGQAPDKTQLTEQGGKLKAERIGAFVDRLQIVPKILLYSIFQCLA